MKVCFTVDTEGLSAVGLADLLHSLRSAGPYPLPKGAKVYAEGDTIGFVWEVETDEKPSFIPT